MFVPERQVKLSLQEMATYRKLRCRDVFIFERWLRRKVFQLHPQVQVLEDYGRKKWGEAGKELDVKYDVDALLKVGKRRLKTSFKVNSAELVDEPTAVISAEKAKTDKNTYLFLKESLEQGSYEGPDLHLSVWHLLRDPSTLQYDVFLTDYKKLLEVEPRLRRGRYGNQFAFFPYSEVDHLRL